MNNLQVLVAQIGTRSARAQPRTMLLDESDLPGDGWRLCSQRSWRMGAWGIPPSDANRRACQAGLFTGSRVFEQASPTRWLSTQVLQFASILDAQSEVPGMQERLMPNPRARVTIVDERTIHGHRVAGLANLWVFEQLTVGLERPTYTRYVAGSVEFVVTMLMCTGDRGQWPWDEVMSIATMQSSKVRATISNRTGPSRLSR